MNDEEILKRCKEQLEQYRSISVWHFMETILKIPFNEMLVRRIHAKLLEDKMYIEDAKLDKKQFHRIRFNRDYTAERNQTIFNVLNLIVAFGALVVAIIALCKS